MNHSALVLQNEKVKGVKTGARLCVLMDRLKKGVVVQY